MEHSKAQFRALRERVGLSQRDVADDLGINIRTVKRWEHPDGGQMPSDDAWDVLDIAMGIQKQQVGYALDLLDGQIGEADMPQSVVLAYYRDQASYDRFAGGRGRFGQANATARAVASVMEDQGCKVVFAYPGEAVALALDSRYGMLLQPTSIP